MGLTLSTPGLDSFINMKIVWILFNIKMINIDVIEKDVSWNHSFSIILRGTKPIGLLLKVQLMCFTCYIFSECCLSPLRAQDLSSKGIDSLKQVWVFSLRESSDQPFVLALCTRLIHSHKLDVSNFQSCLQWKCERLVCPLLCMLSHLWVYFHNLKNVMLCNLYQL